jgi:hypothetical protein
MIVTRKAVAKNATVKTINANGLHVSAVTVNSITLIFVLIKYIGPYSLPCMVMGIVNKRGLNSKNGLITVLSGF